MRKRDSGQGVVETLFIVLILAVLFFGAFELSRAVILKHSLDVATEKAARLLSIAPSDYATADALIRDEVDGNILGGGYGAAVHVYLIEAGSGAVITDVDLANAPFGYRFWVAADVDWAEHVTFLPVETRTIFAMHQGIVERYP
jgi:Flp pilus assembly protein TadG